jgi:hypoxanthine phosphoribosyltransferase
MKFKNKIYLDYSDVLSMCHNLEDIASKLKPDLIVGIVRGGLLPALHLSHALERPMETVHGKLEINLVSSIVTLFNKQLIQERQYYL